MPLAMTGASKTPWTKRRPAPVDSPLRTSEKPLKDLPSGSSVRPPRFLTLSRTTLALSVGKVKRIIAAWSVGVTSAFRPFSKVTP